MSKKHFRKRLSKLFHSPEIQKSLTIALSMIGFSLALATVTLSFVLMVNFY